MTTQLKYKTRTHKYLQLVCHSLILFFLLFSCSKDVPVRKFVTEKVIIVVIDGARYSETWGDSSRTNIPFLSGEMAKMGVVSTRFYNQGPTYTLSGHTSITTGYYQEIQNAGQEPPEYPSLLHYFIQRSPQSKDAAWVVASKGKLQVLSQTRTQNFEAFTPRTNCGIDGTGTGYRDDSITLRVFKKIVGEQKPELMILNFSGPDIAGHSGNREEYIRSVKLADDYVYQVWQFLNNHPFYRGKTTLFVTNDHGRHTDGVADGFVSHGDGCTGCRHLMLYCYGPDFREGIVTNSPAELIDIHATVSRILHLDKGNGQGRVMYALFKSW